MVEDNEDDVVFEGQLLPNKLRWVTTEAIFII